jgi:hypothetical protein
LLHLPYVFAAEFFLAAVALARACLILMTLAYTVVEMQVYVRRSSASHPISFYRTFVTMTQAEGFWLVIFISLVDAKSNNKG